MTVKEARDLEVIGVNGTNLTMTQLVFEWFMMILAD